MVTGNTKKVSDDTPRDITPVTALAEGVRGRYVRVFYVDEDRETLHLELAAWNGPTETQVPIFYGADLATAHATSYDNVVDDVNVVIAGLNAQVAP